jgi:adenine deaminase
VLRRLVRNGLDPIQAIRCATINNAIRLRRDDLGLVAAGRRADLAVLSDLTAMTVAAVYTNGRRVAADGRMVEAIKPPLTVPPVRTMKVGALAADDFAIRAPNINTNRAIVRTIKGARFTKWGEREVTLRDGRVVVPEDVSLMTVIHRHGRNQVGPQTAIIEDWGRWQGAYASSYSHDSHNLVVYGADPSEMALAANTVIEMGGGNAVVKNGKVIAQIAFPVAGLLSALPPKEVASEHRRVVEAAGEVCEWQLPYRTFKALQGQCLACNSGPHLTDLGLTDGDTREVFGAVIRAA